MSDRVDALLTSDGQEWRNELDAAPSLPGLLDEHAVVASPRSSRHRPALLLAIACSVAAVIAVAVTLSVVSRPSGKAGGGTATASFVGFRWRAVDVTHAGEHTMIPQRLGAFFGFSPDGTYTATYGYDGRYQSTSKGFRTYHVSVPYDLQRSSNPTAAIMMTAAQSVSLASQGVAAQVRGQQLILSVGTYRITCVRAGAQSNPVSQLPSSTSTPS